MKLNQKIFWLTDGDIQRLEVLRKRLMRMEIDSSYSILASAGISLLFDLKDEKIAMAIKVAERDRKYGIDYRNQPDEIQVQLKLLDQLRRKLKKFGVNAAEEWKTAEGRKRMREFFDKEMREFFRKSKKWKKVLEREKNPMEARNKDENHD